MPRKPKRKPRASRALLKAETDRDAYRVMCDRALKRAEIAEGHTVTLQQQIAKAAADAGKRADYQKSVIHDMTAELGRHKVALEQSREEITTLSGKLSLLSEPPAESPSPLEKVFFKQEVPVETWPPPGQSEMDTELEILADVLSLLEVLTPQQRARVLAMTDARYYDPPPKTAK